MICFKIATTTSKHACYN